MLHFKQDTEFPRVYYRNTINTCFFLFHFFSFSIFFFFLVTGAEQFFGSCAQPLTGNPACFFSPQTDLGPDAKSNTDLNSAPLLILPLVFTQGVVPGTFNAI